MREIIKIRQKSLLYLVAIAKAEHSKCLGYLAAGMANFIPSGFLAIVVSGDLRRQFVSHYR